MSSIEELHLLIPGLLPDLAGREQNDFPQPDTPSLALLLARGALASQAGRSGHELLFSVLGGDCDVLPVAPYSYLARTGTAEDRWLVQADLVCLRPDRDSLLLYPAEDCGLTEDESRQLYESVCEHFPELADDLICEGTRWYLRCSEKPQLPVSALDQIAGTPLPGRFLDDMEPHWRALLNELQMLFYSHPVNQRREEKGMVPINGLWFWGSGRLADDHTKAWQCLVGASEVLQGLAKHHGLQWTAEDAHFQPESLEGRSLVLLTDTKDCAKHLDVFAWRDALQSLESRWFAPLLRALQRGQCRRVFLYGGDGRCWSIGRSDLWRVWRRPQKLSRYLAVSE